MRIWPLIVPALLVLLSNAATAQTTRPATRPSQGRDLIDAIVRHRQQRAIELVRGGADVNFKESQRGSTALYYAAGKPDMVEVGRLLIERGADVNAQCIGGFTPLHNACMSGSPEMVELLISKGAGVNAKERSSGDTPIFPAAARIGSSRGDTANVLKILTDHGADINFVDKDGETPLDLAIKFENTNAAQFIIAHGGKTGDAIKKEAGK